MFGLGISEIILIMAVALIFLGPEHLPEFSRTLGKNVGQLKRILDDLKNELNSSINEVSKETKEEIVRIEKIEPKVIAEPPNEVEKTNPPKENKEEGK